MDAPRYFCYYNEQQLTQLLKEAGYQIISMNTTDNDKRIDILATPIQTPAEFCSLSFYDQHTRNALSDGTKTIETRALNPHEPHRYFGDMKQ